MRKLGIFGAALLLAACVTSAEKTESTAEQPLSTCCNKRVTAEHALTPEQIRMHERDALAGYATPALMLYRHYCYAAPDMALARRWLTVGAKTGNPQVMAELVHLLSRSSDPVDRAEAEAWAGKLRASGEAPKPKAWRPCFVAAGG